MTIAVSIFGGGYRCYDATPTKPSPPQGLQLVLKEPSQWATAADGSGKTGASVGSGSSSGGGTPVTDTVVMNNLGYFQLQASPGVRMYSKRKEIIYKNRGSGTKPRIVRGFDAYPF